MSTPRVSSLISWCLICKVTFHPSRFFRACQFLTPSDKEELVCYGEELTNVCCLFGQDRGGQKALISEVQFREEWLMFRHILQCSLIQRCSGKCCSVFITLKGLLFRLFKCLRVCLQFALSLVYCERGFSWFENLIKTSLRNRLKVSSVNTLLQICIHP